MLNRRLLWIVFAVTAIAVAVVQFVPSGSPGAAVSGQDQALGNAPERAPDPE